MEKFLYVCVKSKDGVDVPERVFRSKESAMRWMRSEFIHMKDDTGLGNKDFEWDDDNSTSIGLDGRLATFWKKEVFSTSSREIALKVWRVPFDAGSLREVFVCQTETEECTYVSGIVADLESAREWMRKMFVEHRDENGTDNEDYEWNNDPDRGAWDCIYTLDRASWLVMRLEIAD